MIANNNPHVQVPNLLRHIRATLAGGSAIAYGRPLSPPMIEQEVQATALPEEKTPVDAVYHLNDFLVHHDKAFIKYAYQKILLREPDATGFHHFLEALRGAQLTKIDILGRLRFSQEGRLRKARIHGLLIPFALHTSFHIPVIGYVLSLCAAILQLPTILREKTQFEMWARLQNEDITAQIADINIVDFEHAVHDVRCQLYNQHRMTERFFLMVQRHLHNSPEIAPENRWLDTFYANFENTFRGTRESVKERQQVYLPFILEAQAGTVENPVLDIGSGRGEWLELLQDNGLVGHGVERNHLFVRQCLERQLQVIDEDALDYVSSLPDQTLGGVTGFHIIEHLPIRTLVALIDEVLRVLKPGGVAIFETPNPANLLVGSCDFYRDPTHLHPIPMPLGQYLFEERGFCPVQTLALNPADPAQNFAQAEPAVRDALNQHFFGPQDYALIAYKAKG